VELVRGVSLARLMKTVVDTGEMFSERMVVYLGRCLADGLAAAHAQRAPTGEPLELVHRDLTPGNVLLGADGTVKIADFGIAKAKQRITRTLTGLLKGAAQFMSPEQIRGDGLDGRSDIFTLGVVLFELFAARRPWTAANELETMRAVVEQRPADLRELRPRLDRALVEVVEHCLEKDPAMRYQSARLLCERLDEWLSAHGYRDGNDAALARFVRRNALRQLRWFDRAIGGEFAAAAQTEQAQLIELMAQSEAALALGSSDVEGAPAAQSSESERVRRHQVDWGEDGPTMVQHSDAAREFASDVVAQRGRVRLPSIEATTERLLASHPRLEDDHQNVAIDDDAATRSRPRPSRRGTPEVPSPIGSADSTLTVVAHSVTRGVVRSAEPPGIVASPDPAAPPVPRRLASSAPPPTSMRSAQASRSGAAPPVTASREGSTDDVTMPHAPFGLESMTIPRAPFDSEPMHLVRVQARATQNTAPFFAAMPALAPGQPAQIDGLAAEARELIAVASRAAEEARRAQDVAALRMKIAELAEEALSLEKDGRHDEARRRFDEARTLDQEARLREPAARGADVALPSLDTRSFRRLGLAFRQRDRTELATLAVAVAVAVVILSVVMVVAVG
ncbi:MAG: hypothetical protein EXR75_16215, partial [Myxococcales bacterium]|nr:hypothetical protein [Myxococcales bacterium]